MEHLTKARQDTLLFRATIGALLLAGALMLYFAVGSKLPPDDAPAPTVPTGDAPPPSRI